MRRSTATVLGLVAATSVLTACGSNGSNATDAGAQPAPGARSTATTTTPTTRPTPAPSTTAQPTTTSAPAEASDAADVRAPKFPAGTGPQFAKNNGAWDLVLRQIRVGKHDGFDRVVVEFNGTGTPGWGTRYVKTPTAEGSGEAVHVRGDNFLDIDISGVTIRNRYPKTPADFFHGARHFAPKHGGDIEDINLLGVFEGYSQLFLGIDGDKVQYRVFALTNPSRLVVDVKDV